MKISSTRQGRALGLTLRKDRVLVVSALISRSVLAEWGDGPWPWQVLRSWLRAGDSWNLPDSQQLVMLRTLYGILEKRSCAGPSVSLKDSLGRICH